ncbi:MAG: dihydrodipicolinate synthase family protein [Bacilli bacterium]
MSFKQVVPIISVPFKEDYQVDYDSFIKTLKYLRTTNISGITLFGIASEYLKLAEEEMYLLADIFVAELKDSTIKSIISITRHSLYLALKDLNYYEQLGVDALMLLHPFALNPTLSNIKEHIETIALASTKPLLIQYAPGETKHIIDMEYFYELSKRFSNISYKIESNPPLQDIKQLLGYDSHINIMNGYAGLYMIDVLNLQGAGVMPGCSFVEIYIEIYRLYQINQEQAYKLHQKLLPYLKRWMSHTEYIIKIEKQILFQRSIIASGQTRLPSYQLSADDYVMINDFLIEFNDILKGGLYEL